MTPPNDPPSLLLVEDDPDDVLLLQEAIRRSEVELDLRTIEDGAHLLDYLNGEGRFSDDGPRRPDLVLVDINMPMLDGVDAIRGVKADGRLRTIPMAVLTTSNRESDVGRAYEAGAVSYITKPNRFDDLVSMVELLDVYWFKSVTLPPHVS